jgi:SAM-dependent methyltransferase
VGLDPLAYRRSLRGRLNARRCRHALAIAGVLPSDHILDLGCGNGLKSVAAWNRVNPIVGVDRLPPDRVSAPGGNFRYVQADVRDLSAFPSGSFEVVVSFGLLEHLAPPDAERVMRKSRRIGARYVHVVPHRFAFVEPHVRLPLFALWPAGLRTIALRLLRPSRPAHRPLRLWWRSSRDLLDLTGDPCARVTRHWYGPLLMYAIVHGRGAAD